MLSFLGDDGETWHVLRVGSENYCYALAGDLLINDNEAWGKTKFKVEKLP